MSRLVVPNRIVGEKSKIVPFFSPEHNTQAIIMDQNIEAFRIFEHCVLPDSNIHFKRKAKYEVVGLRE